MTILNTEELVEVMDFLSKEEIDVQLYDKFWFTKEQNTQDHLLLMNYINIWKGIKTKQEKEDFVSPHKSKISFLLANHIFDITNNTVNSKINCKEFNSIDQDTLYELARLYNKYSIYLLSKELFQVFENFDIIKDVNGNVINDFSKYKTVHQFSCLDGVNTNNIRLYVENNIYHFNCNYLINPLLIGFIKIEDYPQVSNDVYKCSICGQLYYSILLPKHNEDDFVYCPRCKKHSKCYYCGKRMVNCYDMFTIDGEHGTETCCRDCFYEHEKYFIKPYHDTPELDYYTYNEDTGKNVYTSSIEFEGYGIELEVGKAGQKNYHSEEVIKCLNEEVYTMRDGSINRDRVLGGCDSEVGGFEIITYPHTEKALYNMKWADAFKYLLRKGYRSHDIKTCGLHMHISRTLFNSDDAIARMIFFYNNWYNDVCKFGRRNKVEANKWAKRNVEDPYFDYIVNYYNLFNKCGDHDERYRVVNLQKGNTIEIRIMRGTLKLDTFLASLDFMITIAKNANTMNNDDIYNLDNWLKGMKSSTYKYMTERKCFGLGKGVRPNNNLELEENIIIEEDNI